MVEPPPQDAHAHEARRPEVVGVGPLVDDRHVAVDPEAGHEAGAVADGRDVVERDDVLTERGASVASFGATPSDVKFRRNTVAQLRRRGIVSPDFR